MHVGTLLPEALASVSFGFVFCVISSSSSSQIHHRSKVWIPAGILPERENLEVPFMTMARKTRGNATRSDFF
jgi:hypothetical protein